MRVEVDVVDALLLVVVIPIYGNNALGNRVDDLLRNLSVILEVVVTAVEGSDIHIRPEHNVLVAVLLSELTDLIEVSLHDLADRLIAVDIHVLSSTEQVSLVHTNVDLTGLEALGERREHVVDELVGSVIVYEHNIRSINRHLAPTESRIHVGEGLDAGDDLHTDRGCELVHLAHLLCGISATHISEVGLTLNGIGILSVEEDTVVAHLLKKRKIPLHSFYLHNGVSRHVEHNAKVLKFISHNKPHSYFLRTALL